jgi:hypothetical protein
MANSRFSIDFGFPLLQWTFKFNYIFVWTNTLMKKKCKTRYFIVPTHITIYSPNFIDVKKTTFEYRVGTILSHTRNAPVYMLLYILWLECWNPPGPTTEPRYWLMSSILLQCSKSVHQLLSPGWKGTVEFSEMKLLTPSRKVQYLKTTS